MSQPDKAHQCEVIHDTSMGYSEKKVNDLIKISTKKNPADMMTKIIPVKKFKAHLNFINGLQEGGEWAYGREPCDVTKGKRKLI